MAIETLIPDIGDSRKCQAILLKTLKMQIIYINMVLFVVVYRPVQWEQALAQV